MKRLVRFTQNLATTVRLQHLSSLMCKWHIHRILIRENSGAFRPKGNYPDWSVAAGWRILVLTFADRGVSRGQHGGSSATVNLSFLHRSSYFSFKYLLIYLHEAEWTLYQTHCYSEHLVAPGIELETSESAARKSDHQTTEAVYRILIRNQIYKQSLEYLLIWGFHGD
jgi:hypothetical protein